MRMNLNAQEFFIPYYTGSKLSKLRTIQFLFLFDIISVKRKGIITNLTSFYFASCSNHSIN